jgi:hypothetical protein
MVDVIVVRDIGIVIPDCIDIDDFVGIGMDIEVEGSRFSGRESVRASGPIILFRTYQWP